MIECRTHKSADRSFSSCKSRWLHAPATTTNCSEIGPVSRAPSLSVAEQLVVVVPVDRDVDETQDVAQEDRKQMPKRREVSSLGRLQFQNHDGDDDCDHAVAERRQSFHTRPPIPAGSAPELASIPAHRPATVLAGIARRRCWRSRPWLGSMRKAKSRTGSDISFCRPSRVPVMFTLYPSVVPFCIMECALLCGTCSRSRYFNTVDWSGEHGVSS